MEPQFRLSALLTQAMRILRKDESSLAVSVAIDEANGCTPTKDGGKLVSRKKVADIFSKETEDLVIRLSELKAIHTFLVQNGLGLHNHPLFELPGIFPSFLECGKVTLYVGARSREQRLDVSSWDVRALFQLYNEAVRVRPSTHVEFQPIWSHSENTSRKRLNFNNRSVGCVGSPRSCRLTEDLLSDMFGVDPYTPNQTPPLPFRFVWEAISADTPASSFAIAPTDERISAETRRTLSQKNCYALMCGDRIYLSDWQSGEAYCDYGLIASQRGSNNSIKLVLAGLSGPATWATALAVTKGMVLDHLPSRGSETTTYAIVEVKVRVGGNTSGDPREPSPESITIVHQGNWNGSNATQGRRKSR